MTDAPLSGFIDTVDPQRITGWAAEAGSDQSVHLRVFDRGVAIADIETDQLREDLGGVFGFCLDMAQGLSPTERHVIEVCRASDGSSLGNSPWVLESDPAAVPLTPLSGHLDIVTHERMAGWARDGDGSVQPAVLQIFDNGIFLTRVIANGQRPDVMKSMQGTERCGFDVILPDLLSPFTRHVIEVRREADGALLGGSPAVLENVDSFDPAMEALIIRAIDALRNVADQERAMSFLLARVDQLAQKRADTLSARPERERESRLRRLGRMSADVGLPKKRALVIDSRLPVPVRDAGSCAVISHMRALQALGYEVSFMASDEMSRAGPDADALKEAGICVYHAPCETSVEDVLRRQAGTFKVVYLHRQTVACRYMGLARQYQPAARLLYSVADLHHLRLQRQAVVQERPELLALSRRIRLEEFTAAWSADAVMTHSRAEMDLLKKAVPEARVYLVPWSVTPAEQITAFEERSGLVFFGNYSHAPNLDAARWLVEEIMPLVWQEAPHIVCVLAGSEMPASLHGLARDGVQVRGHVPDLSGLLAGIRLGLMPLRFGAGVKGKVLECMAAGLPCVMTPVAAEGLPDFPPDLEGLVAGDSRGLAREIIRLHDDKSLWARAGAAGLSYVCKENSVASVIRALALATGDDLPSETGGEEKAVSSLRSSDTTVAERDV
ncbi:glycosyltransferase [Acetobacter fallax]|uniref:Glycosyltransferase n=1 Tax=Acetobacter fallax TaxID=1737473 RepID=A0ABX0KG33_9PROT|nr:glycosyltransferase [Acetobacter fallax]NHO34101.1 glycosyltransferase [Acetobacter fallax]NHO37631.1 glycosyltransferase [Acetobacter fallax]